MQTDKKKRSQKPHKGLRALAAFAFWMAVWQLASMRVGLELVLPSPLSVLGTLGTLASDGAFWMTAAVSLLRVFTGFFIGVVLGALLAALAFALPAVDLLAAPVVRVVRATPVASFIILLVLWLGHALVPVAASALMALPVVWQSTYAGLSSVDADTLELARAYRFGFWKKARYLYAPKSRPSFIAGCVTSLGLAWKAGVAAEVLCQPKYAIGTQLFYSKIYLETPSLFAWTVAVILLSFGLEKLMGALFKRLGTRRPEGSGA